MIILGSEKDLIQRNIERYFLLKIMNTPDVFMVYQFSDKSVLTIAINSFKGAYRALSAMESAQLLLASKEELLSKGLFSVEDINTLAINVQKELEQREAAVKAKEERYQTFLELKKEFEPELCKGIINLSKEEQNHIKDNAEQLIRC